MKSFMQHALELAPPWMSGPVGELYTQALGLFEDLHVESALQAMKASKMLAATFHVSGLKYIGIERNMPRYPSETDDGYKLRLRGAWNAWRQGGTWKVIVDQLAAYGVTADVYVQNSRGPLPNHTTGDVWDWDDNAARWDRFFVVLTSHPWNVEEDWGEPVDDVWADDGSTWGSTATFEEVGAVRSIINRWRRAGMIFPHIIVDDGAFTPPTTGDRMDRIENRPDAAVWDGFGVRDY